MAKKLNPMPPSAKAARRTIWVQAVLALLLGGGLLAAQRFRPEWVPELIDGDVYRVAAGLGIGAVVVLLLTFLMRYQWRVLWIVLVLIQVGMIGGLIWAGVKGLSWVLVVILAFVAFVGLMSLLGRVCRRWFHH